MQHISHSLSHKALVSAVSCIGLLTASAAIGQQKPATPPVSKIPQVTSVFPAGGQRGTSVEIDVRGKNLGAITDLYFTRPIARVENLEAKGPDRLVANVAIDQDAEPGLVELRMVSADGISNLKWFRVDEFPEIIETGDKNDDVAHAQEIQFPSVVNGQLGAADIDCYRIHVPKKQRIIFEVEARRLGSPADVRLRLMDASGRFITEAATTRAITPDERLDYEFETPGDYIIAVEDAQFVGGEGSVYRLRVGTWRYATSMFPLGGRRGESVTLTLEGGNLPHASVQTVQLPSDPDAFSVRPQFVEETGTLVAPMRVAVGDEPEVMEVEPNDDRSKPQEIPVPVAVNGRIGKPGDKDRYLIKAKKGEKLAIEVFADRLGSLLDSVLTVTDKTGKLIVENDDLRPGSAQQQQGKAAQPPISDSRVEFAAPSDGEFVITVDDRYNAGGPEYGYRLVITPGRPDFALTYGAPSAPQKNQQPKNSQLPAPTDVLNLEVGKTATVPVAVTRRGYDGPIELSVQGLPDGVTAEVATIPAKQAAGQLTIKADAEAIGGIRRVQVIGTAKINDQQIKRFVQNEIVVASIDPIHAARYEMSDFALAVLRYEVPLTLKVDGDSLLACGLGTELKVSIDRKAGLKGPVEVRADKLPKGVTAETVVIPENETEGIVKLTSASTASPGKQKIQIISQGKLGAAIVEASAEVSLALVMPFELSLDANEKEIEVVIGDTCIIKLAVKRRGHFEGSIELLVSGLPAGVSASPDKIESDQEEIELILNASDDAKPTKSKKSITIQATGSIGKVKVKVETAPIAVTVKAAN